MLPSAGVHGHCCLRAKVARGEKAPYFAALGVRLNSGLANSRRSLGGEGKGDPRARFAPQRVWRLGGLDPRVDCRFRGVRHTPPPGLREALEFLDLGILAARAVSVRSGRIPLEIGVRRACFVTLPLGVISFVLDASEIDRDSSCLS